MLVGSTYQPQMHAAGYRIGCDSNATRMRPRTVISAHDAPPSAHKASANAPPSATSDNAMAALTSFGAPLPSFA